MTGEDQDRGELRRSPIFDHLNRAVPGSRVFRLARRPHEVRIHLINGSEVAVWLHFWPAGDAIVELRLPDAHITHVTEHEVDGRHEVRLWAADGVALFCSARQWSWHPYEPATEGGLWLLSEEEKAAVRRAVTAVVTRDVAAVSAMLGDAAHAVKDFWYWVDNHWPADTDTGEPRSAARLLLPPPPIDDWEAEATRLEEPDGWLVNVDFLNADNPGQRTDLTLELLLEYSDDGTLTVLAENLHVM